MLPPAFSPRWLVVLLVTAAVWFGLVLLAASLNRGQPPTLEIARGASMSLLLTVAPPVAFGCFGARLGFLGAQLGLVVGYVLMLRAFAGPHTGGFEDLAGVANFLVFGAVGLAAGTIIDIVRFFVGKQRSPQ